MWERSINDFKSAGRGDEKTWIRWFIAVTWGLMWKERNGRIFRGNRHTPQILARKIVHEGCLWGSFC